MFEGALCLLLLRLRAQQRSSDDDALAADGGTVHGGCCSSLCARETGAYDVAEGIRDDACLGERVAATTLIAARKVRSGREGDALGHLRCDDNDAGVDGGARDVASDVITSDLPRLSVTRLGSESVLAQGEQQAPCRE